MKRVLQAEERRLELLGQPLELLDCCLMFGVLERRCTRLVCNLES
jgi:hypothetical protein